MIQRRSDSDIDSSNKIKTRHDDSSSTRKNFFIICLTFALVFTSYNAVVNLQSSVNSDDNIGFYALALNSGFSILSCLFLTNPLIFLCGYKWTMFVSQIVLLAFIAANLHPRAWLMYPVSALCGAFRAALGTAQAAYTSALANEDELNEKTNSVANKYFALFFAALQSSQIWGNLISYVILESGRSHVIPKNTTMCGANYLESEQGSFTVYAKNISTRTAVILYTTFMCFIVISLVIVAVFLDHKRHQQRSHSMNLITESLNYITATWHQIQNPQQLLLISLPFLVGASEAFIYGIFTNSFISCAFGVQYVGLVMFTYGLTACIFSLIVAYMQKFENRLQWAVVAFVLWYGSLFIMLKWHPSIHKIHMLFILASFTGIASAICGPLLSAIHSYLFPGNTEAAFSTMVLSQNLGNVVVYLYGGWFRVRTSIFLQAIYLTITLISYVTLEIRVKRNKSDTSETLPFALPELSPDQVE